MTHCSSSQKCDLAAWADSSSSWIPGQMQGTQYQHKMQYAPSSFLKEPAPYFSVCEQLLNDKNAVYLKTSYRLCHIIIRSLYMDTLVHKSMEKCMCVYIFFSQGSFFCAIYTAIRNCVSVSIVIFKNAKYILQLVVCSFKLSFTHSLPLSCAGHRFLCKQVI